MRARPLLAVAIVTLVVAGSVDHVRALRAASPYALTLLAPRAASGDPLVDPSPVTGPVDRTGPLTITSDGALVVSQRPSDRPGNREATRVRLTDASGAPIRTRLEEISYDLHRIVPARPLARGLVRVSGIARVSSIRVVRGASRLATAPAIDRITNHRSPVDPAQPTGLMRERVVVTLRDPVPADATLLVARWFDWHDDEGGLYGAWTEVTQANGREVVLICANDARCGTGHVPRENERGELRWVDTNGRLSDAVTITVTTAR
jgi:hypothetical protein